MIREDGGHIEAVVTTGGKRYVFRCCFVRFLPCTGLPLFMNSKSAIGAQIEFSHTLTAVLLPFLTYCFLSIVCVSFSVCLCCVDGQHSRQPEFKFDSCFCCVPTRVLTQLLMPRTQWSLLHFTSLQRKCCNQLLACACRALLYWSVSAFSSFTTDCAIVHASRVSIGLPLELHLPIKVAWWQIRATCHKDWMNEMWISHRW
jgi:hypothetical protein